MAGKKGFAGGSGGILALDIKDETQLYENYMPFVQGGALFVPTRKSHELGDDIFFC
jgi:type IV pilus assembly protein PilZ